MTRGIMLMAWGKRGYGFMAYNLAVSIKHHSPGIPIHLIATERVLKEVTDRVVFDSIEFLSDDPSDPGRYKAGIYDLMPFDATLFLDVDGICLQPVEPLFDRLIDSGAYYATFINEVYDINSPNILPQMWWAYRQDIWEHCGFDHSTKFPATQSSIQFIRRSDKTAELYRHFQEAFDNPIPLERLRNKWGGGQPDELYLNIALARMGEWHHIGESSMYFGNTAAKRPHEIAQVYNFLSLFGNRSNIKPMFWDYYDRALMKMMAERGQRHNFKGHLLRSDKIANISSPKTKVVPPTIGRIESVKRSKLPGKVALFTSYFEQQYGDRQRELRKVMELNIACDSIDVIYNLGKYWDNPKVVNVEGYDRPTYTEFISFMQTVEADWYILSNSDIYFTSEIEDIKSLHMDGKVLCLSRWDVLHNGNAKLFDYEWTQDTWIWKGAPKTLKNVDFTMGLPACDNRMAYEIAQIGLIPINPSKDIRTYHLHLTNKRSYKERDRLPGPTLPIPTTKADLYKKKRLLIKQPGKVGDLLIVLPIANWYSERGFDVFWHCPKQYHSLFSYVDYVQPIESDRGNYDKVIDLSFGLDQKSPTHFRWIKERRNVDSFVTYKYRLAGVPLTELRNLKYKRNEVSEMALYDALGIDSGRPYHVVHSSSDYGSPVDILVPGQVVQFSKVGDFTIFDWRKVLEGATSIHCIDSSMANFVDAIDTYAELHYYITDKVPLQSDRTILTKNWKRYDMARV